MKHRRHLSCALVILAIVGSAAGVLAEEDSRPLVVIDPGHGGSRAGARTVEGAQEKAIVLAVARHAARVLGKSARVVFTREEDRDVSLPERVALANRLGARVFVSVHANWSMVAARRGVETYILSAEASDHEALALVHLENEEDEGGEGGFGGAAPKNGGDLDFILGDLERTTAHQDSAALAKRIQDRLGRVRALGPSRGLRQAPFLVLRGAEMPAALVELGYLSNKSQGLALNSAAVQKETGRALAEAITAFLRERSLRRASVEGKEVN
ncbi:MAG: N-acetylmuramoyl-L-alanine amidase [Deltaproteobacteria bacterium]|nr:N-acetylmuramoyl-L-alanine amidase [Deltaproteobacteria bacterium]